MQKLFTSFALLSLLLLAACSNENASVESNTEDTEQTSNSNEPTQEELDVKLKEDAIVLDFVEANGDKVAVDTKVTITGKVTTIMNEGIGGIFTVTTTEGDGYGMFTIENFSMATIEMNTNVTVYGRYKGKDELGFPTITATIVE